MANKKQFGNTNVYSATSMAMDMMEIGVEEGFLPSADTFPHIPEIMMPAREIVAKVHLSYLKWDKESNTREYSTERKIVDKQRLCFYAGMGAVYLWNSNWDQLKNNGIFESLIEPRGFNYMDEYVLHLAGAEYGTEAGKKIDMHIAEVGAPCIAYIFKQHGQRDVIEQLEECFMAMYYYGMVIGMSRLGMH